MINMLMTRLNRFDARSAAIVTLVAATFAVATPVQAQVTGFRQAVAETAATDDDIAAFYRAREFAGIWTGASIEVQERRNALLAAFADAPAHGLPAGRYDVTALVAQLKAARNAAEQGRIEVEMTRLFLQYARDVQTGILTPGRVVAEIKREVPLRDRLETLNAFLETSPRGFLRSLPPSSPEYTRLMREKLRLGAVLNTGGWGPTVRASKLQPGDTGPAVVQLRNRLIAMGHMERSVTAEFDGVLKAAVERFQAANGLDVDGVAGEGTLRALNVPLEERLQSITVAMERERWNNSPRGARHIWVNLTDFTASIVDNDRVTFQTRSVIGARGDDRESPEFSDTMEYMVINPSWYVPRSIVTKEYLPQLQRNRNAVGHIEITDRNGRKINRANVDFSKYTDRTFPFSMRQPPSAGNALGLVKFIFPNQYNIYLHDTPSKSLFGREVRAFSHGCIRLNDPFDFAYALLAKQSTNPEELFQSHLRTGTESRLNLETQVPVHIVYRTAFTTATGALAFRRDVYGRDARIWDALARTGVSVGAVRG